MQAGSVCNRPGVSSNFLAWLPAFAPHGKVLALQSGTRFVTAAQSAAAQLRSRRAVVAVTEGAAGRALHNGLLALEGNVRVIALAERTIAVAG